MASQGVLVAGGTVVRVDTPACGRSAIVYLKLANGKVGEFRVERGTAAKNNGSNKGKGKKVGHGC